MADDKRQIISFGDLSKFNPDKDSIVLINGTHKFAWKAKQQRPQQISQTENDTEVVDSGHQENLSSETAETQDALVDEDAVEDFDGTDFVNQSDEPEPKQYDKHSVLDADYDKIGTEPYDSEFKEASRSYQNASGYSDNAPPPRPPKSNLPLGITDLTSDQIFEGIGITKEELDKLIEFRANQEVRNNFKLFMLGVLFSPITMAGALVGYVRGFNRFFRAKNVEPNLYPLYPIVRVSIAIGIVLAWVAVAAAVVMISLAGPLWYYKYRQLLYIVYFNAAVSAIVFSLFKLWQRGRRKAALEAGKFGSARFALKDELFTLKNKTGFYIGNGHLFNDRGHILTVAGTRGGKGTNLIIPNLLDAGNVETSWVVIDPKGENAAVTAAYQREKGQNVVVLNPWGLLAENVGEAQSFNPLDMLPAIDDPNLVDDVQMIAEMIVPFSQDSSNKFFTDSARIIITGLLMHLVTTQTGDKRTLKTLWEWIRLGTESIGEGYEVLYSIEVFDHELSPWDNLLIGMGMNETPLNGEIIQNARHEINRMASTPETFGSIMSDVLLNTDFLKSPSLQQSLQSGFDPKVLTDGKTTVYVIIPADKLRTHSRWLRLVTTSLMRSVIRAPNNRVTFLLDEFAALGYMPEIETALSTYAGYNVTVWPILQTLGQLVHLYKDNWQTFIGNCTIRQYFSVNDNETAEYVSTAIGTTSNVLVSKKWFGVQDAESNQRYLITPDELRRESGKKIFMFIADLPPTYVDKRPYYYVPTLNSRAKINPYI